jgi:EEF1A lysine methyltransferase 4
MSHIVDSLVRANDDSSNDDINGHEVKSRQESLPKRNSDYSNFDYWEERFKEEKEYEWLMPYRLLADQMKPKLSVESRILIVGCGNSPFSADMYDDGYHRIVNIDFSTIVIEEMKHLHQTDRPEME